MDKEQWEKILEDAKHSEASIDQWESFFAMHNKEKLPELSQHTENPDASEQENQDAEIHATFEKNLSDLTGILKEFKELCDSDLKELEDSFSKLKEKIDGLKKEQGKHMPPEPT